MRPRLNDTMPELDALERLREKVGVWSDPNRCKNYRAVIIAAFSGDYDIIDGELWEKGVIPHPRND